MKLLVLGGGGREHALVWKLASERDVGEMICAPGNAGISQLARCARVNLDDPADMLALAQAEQVDLTVVGPELPLSRGVVDAFRAERMPIFGPTRDAAALESSKIFAKEFMDRHRVPTARYRVCDSADRALATIYRGEFQFPLVLKADGLAAGKGVTIAPDRASAEQSIREMMVDRCFGDAGSRLVIEECLEGREASFFVITDGKQAVTIGSAEDHKRAYDGDEGPNTGGMGAYAPSPLVDADMQARVMAEIVMPVIEGLRAEGREFRGVIYVGLMLTSTGPKVIEFNVRLGDPETQVVLPMLQSDLLPLLVASAVGTLDGLKARVRPEPCVGVVLASGGYPGSYRTGMSISGLDEVEVLSDVQVFHSGTAMHEGRIVTAGGRVLTVVGSGKDYRQAIDVAYDAARRVSFDGLHMRRDIGFKAVTDSGFGIRDSGVGKDDPRRFVTTNRLRVPNPESPIPESRISESRIPNPESRIPNPQSRDQ
jgi:phosphoribosylamine--glycine ligase